jgi:hypothetical protein
MSNCIGEQQVLLYSGDKPGARKALELQLLDIARALKAYAMATADAELSKDAHLTESQARRLPEVALLGQAKRFADLATAHLAVLGPFGVAAAQITELQARANAFSALLDDPGKAIARRHAATLELEALRKKGLLLCKLLDFLVPMYRDTEPDFVGRYKIARRITDPAYRKRALVVRVSGANGGPVYNALISLPALKLQRKTGPGGQIYVDRLKPGIHKLHIAAEGYQPLEQEVKISAHVGKVVEVVLVGV